jgi:hypothetical protein
MRNHDRQRKQRADLTRFTLRRLAIERSTLQAQSTAAHLAAMNALSQGLALADREKTQQELADAESILRSPPFERQGKLL